MSKLDLYFKKLKSMQDLKGVIHTISNSIDFRKKIFIVDSFEVKKLLIERKAYKKLNKKYSKVLDKKIDLKESKKGDTVWCCWFQGLENAPQLPIKCIESIKKTFKNYKIVVITNENLNDYIKIPDFILDKYYNGYISYTHFSDILRTYLIAEYGGIWVDSTVYALDSNLPSYLTDEDLFLFSNNSRNSVIAISSWYICAKSHNLFFETVKALLEEYWKHETYPIHFLYYHMLFTMVINHYPEEWSKVPNYSNIPPHMLGNEIFTKYTEKREKELATMCPVQKLDNSFEKNKPKNVEGTFYEKYIIK